MGGFSQWAYPKRGARRLVQWKEIQFGLVFYEGESSFFFFLNFGNCCIQIRQGERKHPSDLLPLGTLLMPQIFALTALQRQSIPVLESSNSLSTILWADGNVWTIFKDLKILSRNFYFHFLALIHMIYDSLPCWNIFFLNSTFPVLSLPDWGTGQFRQINSHFHNSNSCLVFTKVIQSLISAEIFKVHLKTLSPSFWCYLCKVDRMERRISKDGFTASHSLFCYLIVSSSLILWALRHTD